MKITIDCFVPFVGYPSLEETLKQLKASAFVQTVHVLSSGDFRRDASGSYNVLPVSSLCATDTVKQIAEHSRADYTLIYTKQTTPELGYFALERMVRIAEDSGAGMVYADHYTVCGKERVNTPVADYQQGSLRDDFDFGTVLLYNTEALKKAARQMNTAYLYAGLYDLRLKVAQAYELVHINEYLYTETTDRQRNSSERMFDYVDPKNRQVQIEMEQACTEYLKAVGAYLEPCFEPVSFDTEEFEYEASVIIPVRNRIRTIEAAIDSVLKQKTTFPFNLIVIDNHSTDGTTEVIRKYADNHLLILLTPNREDLGIGGCWNMGVHHPMCGKFAVQLDSDDLYKDENTLQTMVAAFYEQRCAMVVGTYEMTDFDLNTIPPGIIDHKEWTPANGRNNALRINGLGAPRAFYTPVLRDIKVPNTSYGEDYALGLAVSRRYQIGRVYEVVYLCRRWEDNSDASLDRVKLNHHNTYKDRIRTWELKARMALNRKKNKE